MKIDLLHPSRGRAEKAFVNLSFWWQDYMRGHDFNHILSIDSDDPELTRYKEVFPEGYTVLVNPNKSVVEATNKAAEKSKGDILVYLSDDFACPNDWIPLIQKEFEDVDKPMLLKVDDGLQRFDAAVCTIPIMNRQLYNRLGYFWYPEYKSMFVDQDLYEVCKKNGWLKLAPHLKFQHNHYSNGKAEHDETYRRSEANWNQGLALFKARQRAGFPT